MPPYVVLPASRIHVLKTTEQRAFAEQALQAAGYVGFDTEGHQRRIVAVQHRQMPPKDAPTALSQANAALLPATLQRVLAEPAAVSN
jgi:hypothetical protein